jgi:hypothetical protein
LASEIRSACTLNADVDGLTDVSAHLDVLAEETTVEDFVAVEVGGLSDAIELELKLTDLCLKRGAI